MGNQINAAGTSPMKSAKVFFGINIDAHISVYFHINFLFICLPCVSIDVETANWY